MSISLGALWLIFLSSADRGEDFVVLGAEEANGLDLAVSDLALFIDYNNRPSRASGKPGLDVVLCRDLTFVVRKQG